MHSGIVMGGISHTEWGPGAVVDGSEENGTAFSLQQFLRGSDASLLKLLDGIWSSRCHKSSGLWPEVSAICCVVAESSGSGERKFGWIH